MFRFCRSERVALRARSSLCSLARPTIRPAPASLVLRAEREPWDEGRRGSARERTRPGAGCKIALPEIGSGPALECQVAKRIK
jgi:hypothetical protein